VSDVMHITAHETGVVRLFALELDQAEAKRFDAAALGAALGGADLDDPQVDIIDTDVLDELGLSGYLTDGMGVPEAEIAPLAARIDALDGWVVVVRSAAFGGQAVTLTPRAPLRWVASFGETPLDLTAPIVMCAVAVLMVVIAS